VGTGTFAELDPAAPATIAYACADADLALRLYGLENDWFAQHLPAHEILLRELESPVALFTALMEYRGLAVDRQAMEQAETELQQRLDGLRQQLQRGGSRPVKIGANAATDDFKRYLFEDCGLPVQKTTATGRPSVDGEALDLAIDYCQQYHPLALNYLRDVVAYRGLAKLVKTYLTGLREKINPVTGAIHTQFFPLGTETGRFASRNPNCQNLPGAEMHGVNIRAFLTARPGFTLVALDYSQIELRIGAWYTNDPQMLAVYQQGGDIHGVTTAAVYNISLAEAMDQNHPAYKERRTVAKNINFGIFYGLYPKGLQRILKLKAGLSLNLAASETMIANIHRAYPQLEPWQAQIKQAARYRKTVDTARGRRRCLAGITDEDPNQRSHYERAALNHPIQGTAADILKLAMVRLLPGLAERPFIHPVLTVHDEIVFEVASDQLATAIPWLKATLEAPPFPGFTVPLIAAVATGPSYGTLTPWPGK
jgi:DNA polymerase-1